MAEYSQASLTCEKGSNAFLLVIIIIPSETLLQRTLFAPAVEADQIWMGLRTMLNYYNTY